MGKPPTRLNSPFSPLPSYSVLHIYIRSKRLSPERGRTARSQYDRIRRNELGQPRVRLGNREHKQVRPTELTRSTEPLRSILPKFLASVNFSVSLISIRSGLLGRYFRCETTLSRSHKMNIHVYTRASVYTFLRFLFLWIFATVRSGTATDYTLSGYICPFCVRSVRVADEYVFIRYCARLYARSRYALRTLLVPYMHARSLDWLCGGRASVQLRIAWKIKLSGASSTVK